MKTVEEWIEEILDAIEGHERKTALAVIVEAFRDEYEAAVIDAIKTLEGYDMDIPEARGMYICAEGLLENEIIAMIKSLREKA